MFEAVREIFEPSHKGLLLPVTGAAGAALTVAAILAGTLAHPFTVAATE